VDEEIQKRFQRYRNYAAETGNIDLSDIDLEYGRKEYAADCMGEMMTRYNLLRKMASQDRNLVQQALDKVKAFADKAGDLVNKLTDRHVTRNLSEAKIYAAEADTMAQLLRDGLSRAEGIKNTATEGGEGKQYSLTSIDTDPDHHTADEMARINDYLSYQDTALGDFFDKYIKDKNAPFARYTISQVSARQAADIQSLLGMDVSGFSNAINKNAVLHIEERHGINGKADQTMREIGDASRIGYVLQNYDEVKRVVNKDGSFAHSSEFRDSSGFPAPMLMYTKKVDGQYYVVMATPENKYQKLWVVTAYMNSKSGTVTQAPAVLATGSTPKASLASPVSANPSIAAESNSVNTSTEENSESPMYSLDEEWEDELPDSGEQPVSGFDAYRNEDGIEDTLEDGTRLLSKQDSQNLARELRNSFGSRMRISDLSTSLRQIADTADGMVEMYLRMVQGNMTGAEAQQLWNEQYAPVEAMAYELADEIIENGETGGPLDTETHAVLREALTGDRIYVPETLKEDVARGLGYESWGEARKARLNILGKTVNDPARGTSIDVIYNNLVDSTPFAVSGDAGNPADQLVEMIQAYDKAEKPSSRHNTLAMTEEQRQENRKKIAGQ
jgi:hypothetical protein